MENYEKEPSHIEHYVDVDPFDDPQYFHIEVLKDKGIANMVNRGLKNFGPGKPIVWYAEGRAAHKAVSCAEIMKTYYKKPIHQITKVNQMR
jgi:DNA-binding protein